MGNMGGGHLMTRAGYDIPHLISILKKFKEKYRVDIILEPVVLLHGKPATSWHMWSILWIITVSKHS
jgi:hypothetical protein